MSLNYDLFRALKNWAREYLEARLAALVSVSEYTLTTADGQGDKVAGYQTEGSDETPYDFIVRRVFPFGIRSRPPAKSGVLAVRLGRGGRSGDGVVVGAESSRFGPSDLKEGEVAVYNKVTGCVVKLDENGKITITAAAGQNVEVTAGAGANVVLNGGSLDVARKTDPISSATAGPYAVSPQIIQSGNPNIKG